MYKFLNLALLSLCFSATAYAHGEEDLGPHNGYIKMPGAYHVEAVPKKNGVDILLLDINFEDPTVSNSFVKASIRSGTSVIKLVCTAKEDYFTCPVDERLLAAKGTLSVESKRDKSEGMTVEYALPLHLNK